MAGDGTPPALSADATGPARTTRRTRALLVAALAAITFAVYAPNLRDYFLGDDFDLIGSFHGKPPSYFLRLLADNASGDAWKDWGLDAAQGRGFLRPLHIWLLELDSVVWGTNPLGFHLTATIAAVALVIALFLILETLEVSPVVAFLGASTLAIHPILSAVVPFIAAREETVTTGLCLFAFFFFLRARLRASSEAPSLVCFALALLTKESAAAWIALPLGHDALRLGGRATARSLVRFYACLAFLFLGYLSLRWLAFGNVVGGDGRPTHYFSLAAFLSYHGELWRNLFAPRLFDDHGVPALRWLAAGATVTLAVLSFAGSGSRRGSWPRLALFFGPCWYVATTALFYGTYYDDRHHTLPLAGLVLFFSLAAERALEGWGRPARTLAVGAAFVAAAATLLPATLRVAGQFHEASRVTARAREEIDMLTRGLPDGSAVLLVNTPLQEDPPFYFGWGLQSALRPPFTAANTSRRLRIVDRLDSIMNRSTAPLPERFDLTIRFSADALGRVESVSGR